MELLLKQIGENIRNPKTDGGTSFDELFSGVAVVLWMQNMFRGLWDGLKSGKRVPNGP